MKLEEKQLPEMTVPDLEIQNFNKEIETQTNSENELPLSENLNLDFIENGWDSAGLKLISINNLNFPKTNILQKALDKIHSI